MRRLKNKSPAKVNLTFRVVKKRSDGYHDIETLMQAVTLCDWVSLSFSENDKLTCTDSSIPTDETNLAWRAVMLFRQKTGVLDPVHVHIDKHIPAGAGLGGGSSNAATTLFMLCQLFNHAMSDNKLQTWAAELGSDVPFFFSTGTALCKGRGEVLQDQLLPKQLPSYIAKPKSMHLSTPVVYSVCKPGESLEPAAFRVLPELLDVKNKLCALDFDHVSMSGSGSSFICYGGQNPQLEGVDFYPISALRKKAGEWYS